MENIYLPNAIPGKISSLFLFFGSITIFFGCASQYRHVQPQSLEYHATPQVLHEGDIEITYRYNVLAYANNKKYAKMERKEGVSLLALRIANNSNDTLFFPQDILIEGRKEYVFPLDMDEAIDIFIQDQSPIVSEISNSAAGAVTFNTSWGWVVPLAASIPGIVNSSVESRANDRFINEMLDYYLVYSNIPPGSTVSGLLALPVRPLTPLTFSKL